jgi:hypothetical protein
MENAKEIELAQQLAQKLTTKEAQAVTRWVTELLEIRQSAVPMKDKARQALQVTVTSDIILGLARLLVRELKRVGWDERSWSSRLALSGISLGVLLFGNEGAGIAAMGGAVGLPLWIVFGAGGAFAGTLLQELRKSFTRS